MSFFDLIMLTETQWSVLRGHAARIFDDLRAAPIEGTVATYIPQLAHRDPRDLAIALVTTDGRVFQLGDTGARFTVQSTSKPTTYALALEEHGAEVVARHVGREPSGQAFNSYFFPEDGRPSNPLINAGAIMCTSLIKPHRPQYERFEHVLSHWKRVCGDERVGFDNSTYLSEADQPFRNLALASMMQCRGVFPPDTDLQKTLELYFQCCSITTNVEGLARMGACLANGGRTDQRIFAPETVRDVLTVMLTSGMYDYSGRWTYEVGVPAKSGVSGTLLLVVPNQFALAVYSPPLDEWGNTARGVAFAKRLSCAFPINLIETALNFTDDAPSIAVAIANPHDYRHLIVARGDDRHATDYDRRTALHVAMEDGHVVPMAVLLWLGASPFAVDRWGNAPVHALQRQSHLLLPYVRVRALRRTLRRWMSYNHWTRTGR